MDTQFPLLGREQFKSEIARILETESRPLQALYQKKQKEETKFNLLKNFESKVYELENVLSELSYLKKFLEFKVELGQGSEFVKVSMNKNHLSPGQYWIEIKELAKKSSALTNGFQNPDQKIFSQGLITVELKNGNFFELPLQQNQSSLREIVQTINQDLNFPFQAILIQEKIDSEAPWKILLSEKNNGTANQINPEFYFIEDCQEIYIEQEHPSHHAVLILNDFPIEFQDNQIVNLIPGLNLEILEARPHQPFLLKILPDFQNMGNKFKFFIDQLNEILSFILYQNAIDDQTDTSITLAGDTMLNIIESQLRNLIHLPYLQKDGEKVYLHQIGIEFEKSGLLKLNLEKLQSQLAIDFENFFQMMNGSEGFIQKVSELISNCTELGNGFFKVKENVLHSRVNQINQQIEKKSQFIEQRKNQITEQFSRLQKTLAHFQEQQRYLNTSLSGGNALQSLNH